MIDLILVTIAASMLLMIVARWVLPAIGLPGVDYETAHKVVKLASFMMFFVIMSLATPWLYQKRREFIKLRRNNPKIWYADGWEVFFLGRKASSEESGLSPAEAADADDYLPEDYLQEDYLLEDDYLPENRLPENQLDEQEYAHGEEEEESAPHFDGRTFSEIPILDKNGSPSVEAEREAAVAEDRGESLTTPKLPICQLPPPLPEFAGRGAELAELTAAWNDSRYKVLGLLGAGGVGKTTLATKFAHDLAQDYPDAQLYLDLKGARLRPLYTGEALSQIIRAFMPTAMLPERENELAQMYRSVLEGKKALILFDNASDTEQIAPLLPPAGCLSIVTSRETIDLPEMHTTRLEGLPPQEARELLTRIVPRLGDHAERLAELCGRLPLALRVAASTITLHPELSFDDYCRGLEYMQSPAGGNNEPFEAVVQGTYQLLDQGLQRLWRVLTVFPDTFDINAAASVWRINPGRATDALDYLMFYSLIDRNRTTGRFRLHDLMLNFID
ncbi:MAG: hypothetical protein J2P31_05175, partial [Blastocatellia bacterium]|nr:hypothetical protein [Blastocatellia bacterium]